MNAHINLYKKYGKRLNVKSSARSSPDFYDCSVPC